MEKDIHWFSTKSRSRSKLQGRRFQLDIRKTFSTVRALLLWNILPREGVDSSSLEIFKQRLDRHLLERRISCYKQGVRLDDLVDTFQLDDSMILASSKVVGAPIIENQYRD